MIEFPLVPAASKLQDTGSYGVLERTDGSLNPMPVVHRTILGVGEVPKQNMNHSETQTPNLVKWQVYLSSVYYIGDNAGSSLLGDFNAAARGKVKLTVTLRSPFVVW